MTTKQLAKQLGLIRRSSKLSVNCKNGSSPKSRQFFQYLIIIDFESTCWKDIKHYGQEIIEFPAVLLNTSSGEIESEFHTYVQPQEHPILSEFCTELTGIKQQQVDDGVPLKICLSQFSNWIQKLRNEKGIIFPSVLPNQASLEQKMCAFVTWSDWDLGVCLLYECKRKQLRKPDILNSWIDLRLTYKLFYNRKPKGLNGALQDVGIEFSGREHSGLDDSRNTARLAWRMICDGCVMKITKSLEKVQPPTPSAQTRTVLPKETNISEQGDGSRSSKVNKQDLEGNLTSSRSGATNEGKCTLYVPPKQLNKASDVVHSDILPAQTLLNGLSTTILGYGNKYRYSNQKSLGTFTSTPANHPHQSHVLFSTTIVSVNDVSGLDADCSSDLSILADWEEAAVLEDSQEEQSEDEECVLLPVDSPSSTMLRLQNYQDKPTLQPHTGSKSVVYKSPDTTIYNVLKKKQVSSSSTFKLPTAASTSTFKLPTAASTSTFKLPTAASTSTLKLPTAPSNKPGVTSQSKQSSKTMSLLDYFPKRKLSSVSFSSPPKKRSFTIHEDRRNQTLPPAIGSSHKVPRAVLNSTVNGSTRHARITAPTCNCGRRAKKLTVSNGGPNHGRVFYSCAVRKRDDDGKGCSYFKWEETLIKEKSLMSSSILSTSGISFTSNTSLATSVCAEPQKTFTLRPSLRT